MNNSFLRRLKSGVAIWYTQYVANLDRRKFGFIAEDVTLTPPLTLVNPKNVFLYGDNGLKDAKIFTQNARFIMKPHSGAAEGLRVSTGNHAMIIGQFYRSIKEVDKPSGLDKDVIVESDVWIGRNVTLLAGVHIGRGCTVGAGAVVTKSMPPYCTCVGVPARPIKVKWAINEILQHELQLYPQEERFSREELVDIYSEYGLPVK